MHCCAPTNILNCKGSLRCRIKFSAEIVIGMCTHRGSKERPEGWIHTLVQGEPDSGWHQKLQGDGMDLSVGCREVTALPCHFLVGCILNSST